MTDTTHEAQGAAPTPYSDRTERLLFGGVIIGSNTLAMIALAFYEIPSGNATVVGQIAGGLSAALGIIAANTWKTSVTERQQAQTLQTMARAASAPVTETTTTTVEKGVSNDVQAGSPQPGPAEGRTP